VCVRINADVGFAPKPRAEEGTRSPLPHSLPTKAACVHLQAVPTIQLALKIERTANEVFDGDRLGILFGTHRWAEVTRVIKQTIGELGQKLGYQVAASGFPGHFDPGWVYDLTWFVPGHGRFEVAVAMESELSPIAIGFDDDFLKLLDSTADVRVWLTCVADSQSAEQHVTSHLKEAERFKKMIPGTVFIFIIFEWKSRTTITKRYTIGQK
jgi:hypothetical protein